MRNASGLICLALACSPYAAAQRRALDWSFYGGDAQRTGWEKSDAAITRDNVKDFQLVIKRKLDNGPGGPRSLTPPVVVGNLISYKGFKELGFVAGSSGALWSIDVDTDRVFWRKQLEAASKPLSAGCPATVTAVPSLTPPLNFARPRTPRAPGAAAAPSPTAPPPNRGILGSGGFGSPRPAFALSSDGKLHLLNTSNGDDLIPAIPFIPPHAVASSLAISDGVVYTTTDSRCGGAPAAVWALDLSAIDPKNPTAPPPQVASFRTGGGNISSLGGVAFGTEGTVYVQTDKSSQTLVALTPKNLALEKYFTTPESKGDANLATPVVFAQNGRDLIVTAGGDGALYLLDAQSLGGEDRKTPLYRTPPLTTAGQGVWGGLSSWQEQGGARWVLASVWGPVNPELKLDSASAAHGSVIAFKVEDQSGKPVLTPVWISRDMSSPEPPVIASGVVFALAALPHATLYALDALTGKELYSTGSQVAAPGSLTGIAVANGRVYFTTTDNTLYAFGIFLER
jgi:outer membrane protein assembly factor BamB